MTTAESTRRERLLLYGVCAAVVLILLGLAVFIGRTARQGPRVEQKADQLIAALTIAGARPPAREQIVRVLGDDGGAVCAGPDDALRRATLATRVSDGAAGPGARPVTVDRRLVVGETLVITIYCPDRLPRFQQFVSWLRTTTTTGG
ncbi:hypothetical protein [Amycolatopsis samaneae]|uniref:DUF4878 domain-containing protein n=1 Tax=Amycolatopsis samaneae TaxID=664691 RepID=A0ABW5GDL9_9PSEU